MRKSWAKSSSILYFPAACLCRIISFFKAFEILLRLLDCFLINQQLDQSKSETMLEDVTRKNPVKSGKILMSAVVSPLLIKSLDQTQSDLYPFWVSQAKPLPFSCWFSSSVSYCNFKSNHQMRIKQGLELSYEKFLSPLWLLFYTSLPIQSVFHYLDCHTQQA